MEQQMTINEDLWAAALPNGEVRSGTLAELNEAVRAGHLGVDTLVRAARSETWIRLVDLLGGGAIGAASAAVAVPPASVPAPPVATQPPPANGSPDLWQVRLANGDVRSGTHEQLEEALRAGHLSEDLMVLAAGAREWAPLGVVVRRKEPPASLAPAAQQPPSVAPPPASAPPQPTAPPPQPHDGDEQWQVRLADGQVRSGTRQQLEEAFNAGHLDEGTLVLAAGGSEWVTLASVANRRQSEPVPAPVVAPEPEPSPVEANPAASVASQPTPGAPAEQAPVEPAGDSPPSVPQRAEDGQQELPSASGGDQVWRVNLTSRQLQQAFHAGLLEHDALVLAVGTDEWVRLGDVTHAQSSGANTANGGE
jgi:hypothetical protein